jgi:diguanylate cyclase (GGDEF)-like protein
MRYKSFALPARRAAKQIVNRTKSLLGQRRPPIGPAERRQNLELRHAVEASSDPQAAADYWRAAYEAEREARLTDPLTGLPNRAAWDMRSDSNCAIAVLDLDGLKWVNDHLGHAAGDQMIRCVAAVLVQNGILAYRVGGDEFYCVFESDLVARLALDDVNQQLANVQGFVFEDGQKRVREIIGVQCTWGVGSTIAEAEDSWRWFQAERERIGARAPRGMKPPKLGEMVGDTRVELDYQEPLLGFYRGFMQTIASIETGDIELIGAVI